ncbi:MAG TPA: cytochrome C oxidase subunit IV family protein [Thermoanaerobaculia bacterium]|nr:cytochrome C oxidase subunit IV family protein [Thermoanaerobaculia bacterium]
MSAHDVEAIRRQTRTYVMVFAALAVLTVVTVAASRLDLNPGMTIAVALLIAAVKGSLVAGYFMHLIDERKAIYWLLALTVIFFILLMFLPLGDAADSIGGVPTPV